MGMKINGVLPSPAEMKEEYPLSAEGAEIKRRRDAEIRDVLTGKDDRFLLVIGPCSADSEAPVLDYVSRLARLSERVKDRVLVIPRIYTNKPRTKGVGYKGMFIQPNPDGAEDIVRGIRSIRALHIAAMEESGLTAADEMGIQIPEQLSLMGFDNISASALSRIDLTTVEQSKREMATQAVDILLNKIERGTRGYVHQILMPSLIKRGSCRMGG